MTAPEWAFGAALAGLPFMTWDRLASLLADQAPSEAWERVCAGAAGAPWARSARATSVEAVAEAHRAVGAVVHLLAEGGYPLGLDGDHQAPAVLFSLGIGASPPARRVGVVGTRRCTGYGRDVARQLGRDLASAGVEVVSGLALGIDGAAHEGALAADGAQPVAVVGSGLDVVYPRRHAELFRRVAAAGVVLSEAPAGARPEPWRFPARNRLIAALSQVLVVVESHHAGGSLHTVQAAAERGVTVMAVPGPIRSLASKGTNQLIADGCAPVCEAADVLAALALETAGWTSAGGPGGVDPRPRPDPAAAGVLEALGWEAASVEELLARTDLAPGPLAVALAHLEQDGWARRVGGWWERAPAP